MTMTMKGRREVRDLKARLERSEQLEQKLRGDLTIVAAQRERLAKRSDELLRVLNGLIGALSALAAGVDQQRFDIETADYEQKVKEFSR